MDPTSFWFLLLMVVVGGFISYYGDILGRKIGKKRKTIHKKIRPQKFAAVVVFIFGCLGTLLTIVVLFATSEPIRNWILEGNAAKERLAKTTQQLQDTEKKFSTAESKLKTLEPELKTKTDEITQKNIELKNAEIEQLTLNSKNKELDRQGKELLKKTAALTAQFKSVNAELLTLKKEKTALSNDIANAIKEQNRLTNNNVAIQERNLDLEKQALELEREANRLTTEYNKIQGEFNNLLAASREADAKFNVQLEQYQKELRDAEKQLNDTLKTLTNEQENLRSIEAMLDRAKNSIYNSRFNPPIFQRDAEINRHVIPSGSNLTETTKGITAFLQETQDIAQEAKAVRTALGDFAGLTEIMENGRTITPEQQKQELARVLVGRPVATVLVATAKQNSFEGDFIPININVYDNTIAFVQGTIIISMQVDGRKSVPEIVKSIINQIDGELADILVRKGMIPMRGSTQPFGELATNRVVEMALEIKEAGIPLRLQLLASRDIYSADKIQFNHRLRP